MIKLIDTAVENWEWIVGVIAMVAGVVLFVRFVLTAALSYRAIRLYHIDTRVGGWWSSLVELAGAVGLNVLRVFNEKSLFKRVRMRLEFESLIERPMPTAELPQPGETTYRQELAAWKAQRSRLFSASGGRELIEVDNASVIHGRFDNLDRLFDVLDRLGRPASEFRFATKVHIKDGFVAPLHLIAGVLRQFDEDWAKIIDTYEADHNLLAAPEPANDVLLTVRELREIQKFIFDCWLQWGPSIPLCGAGCGNFGGSWSSLQYGYGDENNSVELVGTKAYLRDLWQALPPPKGVLAARAKVIGHIASSRFLPDGALTDRIGKALAVSWGADKTAGRLLVLMSERASDMTSGKEEQVANAIGDANVGVFEPHNKSANYYSAYLWAIFTILRRRVDDKEPGEVWMPTNPTLDLGKTSGAPWLDFIPFFEHGNIADRETFYFLKRQLAEKAVAGIVKLVTDSSVYRTTQDPRAYPLRFALASTLDHSGCGADPVFFDGLDPSQSIYALIRAEAAKNPIAQAVVLFDEYTAKHPHASCTLPAMIQSYFGHVEEVTADS